MFLKDSTIAGRRLVARRAVRGDALRRLNPAGRQERPDSHPPGVAGQVLTGTTDPRWVLAVRTSEMLEGSILRPEKRDGLVRLGTTLGLTRFDSNLVIAIVQDQARRGFAPQYCPTAGEPQLRMVPLTPAARLGAAFRARKALYIACAVAALIAVELLILTWTVG